MTSNKKVYSYFPRNDCHIEERAEEIKESGYTPKVSNSSMKKLLGTKSHRMDVKITIVLCIDGKYTIEVVLFLCECKHGHTVRLAREDITCQVRFTPIAELVAAIASNTFDDFPSLKIPAMNKIDAYVSDVRHPLHNDTAETDEMSPCLHSFCEGGRLCSSSADIIKIFFRLAVLVDFAAKYGLDNILLKRHTIAGLSSWVTFRRDATVDSAVHSNDSQNGEALPWRVEKVVVGPPSKIDTVYAAYKIMRDIDDGALIIGLDHNDPANRTEMSMMRAILRVGDEQLSDATALSSLRVTMKMFQPLAVPEITHRIIRDELLLVKLFNDLACQLDALHAFHIAHGDVREENVLVDTSLPFDRSNQSRRLFWLIDLELAAPCNVVPITWNSVITSLYHLGTSHAVPESSALDTSARASPRTKVGL